MNTHGLEHELLKGRLLTPAEFCQRLGIDKRTLKRWITTHEIHAVKLGPQNIDAMGRDRRAVRIPETEIYRLCEVHLRD